MIESEFALNERKLEVRAMTGSLCAPKSEPPMTPDRIREKIQWIKDDIHSCECIVRSPESSCAEKAECRQRVLANRKEIVHLESVLTTLKNDPLF